MDVCYLAKHFTVKVPWWHPEFGFIAIAQVNANYSNYTIS
jgi:hypothetical protein